MVTKFCSHLTDSITDLGEIEVVLNHQDDKCTDCECRGPNLWICLYKNCFHIGCAEKSNDHSTIHNAKDPDHCIHMNLSTRRTWCYMCKWEVFLDQLQPQTVNGHEQENSCNGSLNQDSGRSSSNTLRVGSPERGTIFENSSVGLNVGMNGDGDQSDNESDLGNYGDYAVPSKQGGLIGLQNIGNTCYMNAALQALSNTEPLTKFFLDCAHIVQLLSEGKKPGLSRTYQSLIKDMWIRRTSQSYVTPSGILYGIRNVHAMFRGYHQHDTQEFLRNFMDQLHEELKQPAPLELTSTGDGDSLSSAVEEPSVISPNYDSSEGEYETCDSGVSERSSLSDDSEIPHNPNIGVNMNAAKRRLSRCDSPGRRQRQRVQSGSIIDAQPSTTSSQHFGSSHKKQIKYRSIISDIFDGKLLSSVQCLTCDRVSSRVETFQDLSLPIPSGDHLVVLHGRNTVLPNNITCSDALLPVQDGWISWIFTWLRSWFYGPAVTLHDCLSAFFSTDELKGDNMYSCEKCNKLRNGVKFSKVLQLPEVLCIHLKRFRHELMYSSKISSVVSFPLKGLDMWPYLHQNITSKVSNYDLFSVICHHGTAGGGHYTSYALNNGQWYEFDDQYVTKVPSERVQKCEAYVLFYRKSQNVAEPIRRKATQMTEDAVKKGCEDIKRAYISRQWLTRFYNCVEPGPIDNTDFLCHHGAFDPDREYVLEHLACEVPIDLYDYLYKRLGGCPPITSAVICPACTALQNRLITEMKAFLEISRQAQLEKRPHTHYLSTSWYTQWHNFVERNTKDPPGPIDNTKIDLANIDHNEAAAVPECIFDFFYNIYGGGPVLRIPYETVDQAEPENEENGSCDETLLAWDSRNGDAAGQCNGCEVMETEHSEEERLANEHNTSDTETENPSKTESSTKNNQKVPYNQAPRRGSRYRRRSTRSSVH